ncbi:MAG: hypothetical protein ACF8PN_00695 [Phycisphaerales bacterium]
MKKRTLTTMAIAGLAAAGANVATVSGQDIPVVTNETALVEEFTATWCGPCVGAYYALERLKGRWGEDISILTYNIADELDNPYNSRRESEEYVTAIPTFVFQGDRKQVGTPPDSTLDNLVQQALDADRSARIIGRYEVDEATDVLRIGLKIDAYQDVIDPGVDQLRIVVHESNWTWNCSNGLDQYEYHVQAGFDEEFPRQLRPGAPEVFTFEYDLTGNQYLRNWDEVGITVYIFDTTTRKAIASWELGKWNLGDLNGDLKINRDDGRLFRRQYGKSMADPDFNPAADWNRNGVIDLPDRDLFEQYIQDGGLR